MKYGLLIHKPTSNLGDDIQSYAIERFLPEVDYLVDREKIHDFKSKNGEPVATVMAAWWMWYKWSWPPSKYIYPCFVGWHYSDNEAAKQAGCPVDYDFLTGIGKKYLNAYGPVGCRDYFTRDKLQKLGIHAEFSGCITLTLPRQKELSPEREYICLVDVSSKVEEYVRKYLEGTDIDVRIVTHDLDQKAHKKMSWPERSKMVEEVLTVYQNAKCVLTRRLHCALPCLAMGTPVLLVIHTLESIRFFPYYDWLWCCKPEQYVNNQYSYDILNPPANKELHIETRQKLIDRVQNFIESAADINDTAEAVYCLNESEKRIEKWRSRKMWSTAKQWYKVNAADREKIRQTRVKNDAVKETSGLKLSDESEYKNSFKEWQKAVVSAPMNLRIQMMEDRMKLELREMRKNYKEIKRIKK